MAELLHPDWRQPDEEVIWWYDYRHTERFNHTDFYPYYKTVVPISLDPTTFYPTKDTVSVEYRVQKNNNPLSEDVVFRAEKALGIKFNPTQMEYLLTSTPAVFFRQQGATTAYIVSLLLSYPNKMLRLSLTSECCAAIGEGLFPSMNSFKHFLDMAWEIYNKLIKEFKKNEICYLMLWKG